MNQNLIPNKNASTSCNYVPQILAKTIFYLFCPLSNFHHPDDSAGQHPNKAEKITVQQIQSPSVLRGKAGKNTHCVCCTDWKKAILQNHLCTQIYLCIYQFIYYIYIKFSLWLHKIISHIYILLYIATSKFYHLSTWKSCWPPTDAKIILENIATLVFLQVPEYVTHVHMEPSILHPDVVFWSELLKCWKSPKCRQILFAGNVDLFTLLTQNLLPVPRSHLK